MGKTSRSIVLFSISFVLLLACTTRVPATVTQPPVSPLPKDAKIFLKAARDHARVQQSLQNAGFSLATEGSGAKYALLVKIGRWRGSGECGTVNNVAYVLSTIDHRVMVIKGRGPTGTCPGNILDEMSRMLASYAGS